MLKYARNFGLKMRIYLMKIEFVKFYEKGDYKQALKIATSVTLHNLASLCYEAGDYVKAKILTTGDHLFVKGKQSH